MKTCFFLESNRFQIKQININSSNKYRIDKKTSPRTTIEAAYFNPKTYFHKIALKQKMTLKKRSNQF